jgi:hypothetical protein
MSQGMPISDAEGKLRTVRYVRHPGPWHDPQPMENSLLAFVYDIPYFGACGVFPPFHLLNQQFRRGGSQGGMGPGATWEPFELSLEEFRDLVEAVRTVAPESLRDRARYAHLSFRFDPAFDGPPETYPVRAESTEWHRHIPPDLKEYVEWAGAVCAKHRDHWHAELKRAGFTS